MLVNYTLIIVVVVLLFVAYKHKDGFAGEPPINPNGETITQPIMLAIDKSTTQYKSFAGTLQNYCSYYDSGNNINTAINTLALDQTFMNKINTCYNTMTNDISLNECYAKELQEYKPSPNELDGRSFIPFCMKNYTSPTPTTLPTLKKATADALVINNKPNMTPPMLGWPMVNHRVTQVCSAHNSLPQIDQALSAAQSAINQYVPECANSLLNR